MSTSHFLPALLLSVGLVLAVPAHTQAQGVPSTPPRLTLTQIASGLNEPLDIANAPGDARLYVAERSGRIKIIDTAGVVSATPFLDLSSLVNTTNPRQGLLAVTFHPQYATNRQFFVTYTDASFTARIVRYQRSVTNADLADPSSAEVLLSIPIPAPGRNGGGLKFGPDGYLYIAMGDGAGARDPNQQAQNGQLLLGKLLRIDVNTTGPSLPYGIPPTNPYAGSATTRPEIWAMGLRHPWRYSFDRQTGDLWLSDVGQDSVEEINRIPGGVTGGQNFGWPCFEGDLGWGATGCGPITSYTSPVAVFHRPSGLAVTGGYVYRGARYPALRGFYVFVDLISGQFATIEQRPVGPTVTYVVHPDSVINQFGIATFGETNQGELYCADAFAGTIYRVGALPPTGLAPDTDTPLLTVAPNPAGGTCRVTLPASTTGPVTLVSLVTGQTLRHATPTATTATLDLHDLPAGLYAVRATTGQRVLTARLVVE